MCGISGVAGYENIAAILLNSIKNLEYRGYDSCGVALLEGDRIEVRKNTGTIEEVEKKERLTEPKGKLGIAHTRWATHGKVTKLNAHPHTSCNGDFVLVHNGIVSNYKELKEELESKGHIFRSETDTEVIVHLIEERHAQLADAELALVEAVKRLEGSYALALISIYEPEKIFFAKKESPLILGIGSGLNFLGSDFNAFIDYTKDAVILEDGEYGAISREGYYVREVQSQELKTKEIIKIAWDAEMSKKGGYPHYMLKEVYEQPQAVLNALAIEEEEINDIAKRTVASRIFYLLGAGTTYYVCMAGQYFFNAIARRYAAAINSDEFRHLAEVGPGAFALAISQSGETFDTLSALKFARDSGATTAAIVNVMGSSMTRAVDTLVMQRSGPEICVVSTKAAMGQMIILLRLALEVAKLDGILTQREKSAIEAQIGLLPEYIQKVLNERSGFIHNISRSYCHINNWLFIGRGIYYPIALESALKMKETAYLHAEGMAAGFLKHGTLALIEEGVLTVAFIPRKEESELYSATMGSVEEIRARKGFVIGIAFDDEAATFDERLLLPQVPPLIAPFVELVAGQLLAYFTATTLKRDIDKPRSLAKSVTVA